MVLRGSPASVFGFLAASYTFVRIVRDPGSSGLAKKGSPMRHYGARSASEGIFEAALALRFGLP